MPSSALNGDKPIRYTAHFRSSEASNSIPPGCPVCFTLSGTGDANLVELPGSSASVAIGTQLLAGVSQRSVAPGDFGEFVVGGFVRELRVIRGTRAASTDSYASSPAVAIGDHLNLETVANGVSRATVAASGALHPFVAMESVASSASAASTTSDTSTSRVDTLKAYVRLM